MKLIFARHGETEANLADQFQGRLDTPLTKRGEEQAENLGRFIQGLPIEKCLLSPLSRVKATYTIATAHQSIPYTIDERLIEICYGAWEGVTRHELDQTILKERNDHRFTYHYPGDFRGIPGESYAIQYEERMKFFLQDLLAEDMEKTMLIISHQGSLLSTKKFFQQLSDEDAGKIKTPNDEVYLVEVTGVQKYTVTSVVL